VTKNTVEEIIVRRADAKLKLTNVIIEGGQFSHASSFPGISSDSPVQLADMLKFGLNKLFSKDECRLEEQEWKRMLGQSENGRWQVDEDGQYRKQCASEEAKTDESYDDNMYLYEGHDYSTVSAADQEALQKLIAGQSFVLHY
jgi:hypothetical protein